ncbi:hypothetical protein PG995_002234 [Apiospora arundinis]
MSDVARGGMLSSSFAGDLRTHAAPRKGNNNKKDKSGVTFQCRSLPELAFELQAREHFFWVV